MRERVRAIAIARWVKDQFPSELAESEATDIDRNPVEDAHFLTHCAHANSRTRHSIFECSSLGRCYREYRCRIVSSCICAQADAGDQQSQTITASQALDALRSSVSVESSNAESID